MSSNKQEILFKPARLAFLIAFALGAVSMTAHARDYFNPELIELDNPGMKGADLSAFESGSQLPGTYRVDIVLGEQVVDTRDIKFDAVTGADGEASLQPCLSVAQLKSWGVKTELFTELASGGECAKLSAIPQASAERPASGDQHSAGGTLPAGARLRTARDVGRRDHRRDTELQPQWI